MNDAKASYALVRARIELRLAELREALARHEQGRCWDEVEVLERLERALAELVEEVQQP